MFPAEPMLTMTVLHISGVHCVSFRYCGCGVSDKENRWHQLMRNAWYPAMAAYPATCTTFEVLDTFRRLKVIANVNVQDFVTTLEQTTDPHGTEFIPDQYTTFGRMARQWCYLQRLRRAGVGHLVSGIKAAEPGSVTVKCWTCPREGVNLPKGWEQVEDVDECISCPWCHFMADIRFRYLFEKVVSLDANFKMWNCARKLTHADPPLYSSLGYQVPDKLYQDWIKSYMKEEEVRQDQILSSRLLMRLSQISTCIAFAALEQKNTHLSTGLRVSGILGCTCTGHKLV